MHPLFKTILDTHRKAAMVSDTPRQLIEPLDDVLDEIEAYLDDYSDAEIIDGSAQGNREMNLLMRLRDSRSLAKRESR